MFLVNISEDEFRAKKNKHLPAIMEWVANHGGGSVIPFSASFEQSMCDQGGIDQETRAKIAEEIGCQSAVNRIIKTGYKALHLGHYFTAGEDEVRAWTVRLGWKAPQAAGVIHGDFEKGFICAEVFKYSDLKELGDESAVKDLSLIHI